MTGNLYLCSQKNLLTIWLIKSAATFCILLYMFFEAIEFLLKWKEDTYVLISGLVENTVDSVVKKNQKCPLRPKHNI